MILILVNDLLFSTKISQTGKELGKEVKSVRSVLEFKDKLLLENPEFVILDLNAKGVDPFEALKVMRDYNHSNYGAKPVKIIGFFSHVDKELEERARKEGIDEVFPRSKFSKQLPEILQGKEVEVGDEETGASALTTMVFGTLLAASLFIGYHVVPFFYYYYEIQNQMSQIIRVASMESDKEIRKRLMYYIRKYELPVESHELKIERFGKTMNISLPYEEIFYITFRGKDYEIYTFQFYAHAEGDF